MMAPVAALWARRCPSTLHQLCFFFVSSRILRPEKFQPETPDLVRWTIERKDERAASIQQIICHEEQVLEYVKLGSTGVEVSRICLGCMSFGDPQRGTHTWTLPEEPSRDIIRQAFELGINFLDTANVYSDGTSEEIVGRAIRDFSKRDDVVLATKVHGRMRPRRN